MQSFCIEERGTDKNCSGTGLNPACAGTFFTVWRIFRTVDIFSDLNRYAVARALGRARAVELSMARGGGGNRT